MTETREIILTPAEFEATSAKLDKINQRAEKRGFTGRFDLVGTPDVVGERTAAGITVEKAIVRCELSGTAPSYAGWRFLAALDMIPTSDGNPAWIVRTAPGTPDSGVDRGTLKPGHCDHCDTARANRRKLMLVQHVETGEIKQVGSTCIKDFLGWAGNPVWIDLEKVASELAGGGTTWEPQYTPLTVITATIATTAVYGWAPASTDGISTRRRVGILLDGARNEAEHDLIAGIPQQWPAAEAEAPGLLKQAIELSAAGSGDYVQNLHVALSAESVSYRTFGFVCSAVSFVARETQKHEERARLDDHPYEWIGEVGEKVEFTGKVTTCISTEGFMGGTQLLVIVTTDTALVKFYTTARWAMDDDTFDRGSEVTLTGTVKKLTEYQGKKQTVVTRVKPVTTADRA